MKRLLVLAVVVFAITGCAQKVWVKQDGSQDDSSRDRYVCTQEAQQRVSGAEVNPYGEMARSDVMTNKNIFEACMKARGWVLKEREK